MKVAYTDEALAELDGIIDFIRLNYPSAVEGFRVRLDEVVDRIQTFPEGALRIEDEPGVRAVPFGRYPYRLFYRYRNDVVEILHVRHAARDNPFS